MSGRPLSREQKVAQRILSDFGLSPPIDVSKVLREFADVELDTFPADADAVVIHDSARRPRPLVIVDKTKPLSRQRFTLAHELAHLVLPWHIGTMVCHVDRDMMLGEGYFEEAETEANKFASELLMPSDWIDSIASEAQSFLTKLRSLKNGADVSYSAALLSLTRALPLGYLAVVLDDQNRVMLSASSPSTAAKDFQKREKIEPLKLFGHAIHEQLVESSYSVHCWTFGSPEEVLESEDNRSASEILKDIVHSIHSDAPERASKIQSINGIVGAAKGMHGAGKTVPQIIGLLRHKIASKPTCAEICRHKDFDLFLSRKASEITKSK